MNHNIVVILRLIAALASVAILYFLVFVILYYSVSAIITRWESALLAFEEEKKRQPSEEQVKESMIEIVIGKDDGGSKGENSDSKCAVCLAKFKNGESCRVTKGCSHWFHEPCIDGWVDACRSDYPSRDLNCPICRRHLLVV
ncbi:Zinc finger, RING-type [Dillenia turbinata]|uniref:Zinc finger, RING-type n=1 Tax=Dillenia turbinata TaxID=194707 RepID=A0AAN8V6Z7_9MAGN